MANTRMIKPFLLTSALTFAACATPDSDEATTETARAIDVLQQRTGAPVTVEVNEIGTTRVVNTTPGFPVRALVSSPAESATRFLAEHHRAFQLGASDAASFVVTSVDIEPKLGVSHVTMQRMYNGTPVFQGSIVVLMDAS